MGSSTILEDFGAEKIANFLVADKHALFSDLLRSAKFDEAKVFLVEQIALADGDERLSLAIDLAQVEWATKQYTEALRILTEYFPLAGQTNDHVLLWKFHLLLGATYQLLAPRVNRPDYVDRALREYAGAAFHQEQAREFGQAGLTKNNVGFILGELGKFADARAHFADARRLLAGRVVQLAEVDDSEAQVCLMEGGREREAYRLALMSNAVFMEHGEERLLRDSTRTLQAAAAAFTLSANDSTAGSNL